MKYINMLLVFGVIYSVPYASLVLACVMGVFAVVYYHLCFDMAAGLKISGIPETETSNLQSSTLSVGTNLVAVATLIMQTQYAWIGYMAAPWVAITLGTMTLAWLVHFEIIEINMKDDEE